MVPQEREGEVIALSQYDHLPQQWFRVSQPDYKPS